MQLDPAVTAGGEQGLGIREVAVDGANTTITGVAEVAGAIRLTDTGATLAHMSEEMSQHRPAEAARQFLTFIGRDDELAAVLAADLHEVAAPNQHADLRALQNVDPAAPSATDPAALASITSPILLLVVARAPGARDVWMRHLAR